MRRLGVRRFTLVDPKLYSSASVGQQCDRQEVDQHKVDVVARELTQAGAHVRTYAADLFDIPDGVVDADTIVLLSVDNRRAEVGANHLATRMDAPVVKINVEPKYGIAAVRTFHPHGSADVCLECNFTERQYQQQRHPRSCDGGSSARDTASSLALARAAAGLGGVVFLGLLNPERRSQWLGLEIQFSSKTLETRRSRLQPNPRCRWQHDHQWPLLRRLEQEPAQISVAQLVRRAERKTGQRVERLRFCHPVAVAGRCDACGTPQCAMRWVPHADATIDRCQHCQQPVRPVPFEMHRELDRDQLLPICDLPLDTWGVPPLAVIELLGRGSIGTYVLGGGNRSAAHL